MRRLRLKKKSKRKLPKLLLVLFVGFILYQVVNYVSLEVRLVNSNEEFIKYLLQDSNYHLLYEKQNKNIIAKIINFINDFDVQEPVTILENSFAYVDSNELSGSSTNQAVTNQFYYISNPIIDKPRVYIYNTHQGEAYAGKGLEQYNITPGVKMAAYLLQDRLNSLGITTIVEERSVSDYLKANNLDYSQSYQATRKFLIDALDEYQSFDLIIDLHRDALDKELSTTTIDGKSYAKILFVMNQNYSDNIELVKNINNKLNTKFPGLSRGIYDKYKDTFNQDLSKNALLLEIGGQHNTIDEVLNTVDALIEILKEIL